MQTMTAPRGLLFSGFLLSLLLQLWCLAPVIADYYPTNDDIALIANSTPVGQPVEAASWFTRGFVDYFVAYPEWQHSSTAFVRPAVNAWYWLCWQLFGSHWAAQLVVGYVVQALIVAMTGFISLQLFGLRTRSAVLAMTVAALNPAYWTQSQNPFTVPLIAQFPNFHPELLTTLLVMVAFVAFVRRRFILFGLVATLALLMKETAMPLPFAALALPGAWRERWPRALPWLLLPMVVWGIIRVGIYTGGGTAHPFYSEGGASLIVTSLRHLLLWPTALFDAPLLAPLQALKAGELVRTLGFSAMLALNLAWWVAIGFALLRALRGWPATAPSAPVCGLVFALANLALVVLLPHTQIRYGGQWFVLGPAAVLALLKPLEARPLVSAVLVLGIVVQPLWNVVEGISQDSLESYRTIKRSGRQFPEALRFLPPQVRQVYVIDEIFSKSSAPRYTAMLAGFPGRLVFVNSVLPKRGCAPEQPRDEGRYRLTHDGGAVVLDSHLHECLDLVVYDHSTGQDLSALTPDTLFARGPTMQYRYPELQRLEQHFVSRVETDVRLGPRMIVRFDDPICRERAACVWLGYDLVGRRYYVLDFADEARP